MEKKPQPHRSHGTSQGSCCLSWLMAPVNKDPAGSSKTDLFNSISANKAGIIFCSPGDQKIKVRQEWTYCGWWSLLALQTEFEVNWPTHLKFRSCAVSSSYHHCGTVVFSDILCQPQWEKILVFEMSFSTPACENFFRGSFGFSFFSVSIESF